MSMLIKTVFSFLWIVMLSGCDSYSENIQNSPTLSADIRKGAKVFERVGCGACHGDNAQISALGVSRIIAQIGTARDIENALNTLQIPTSNRHNAMKNIAKELSEQDIIDVALYVNSLKI